MENKIKHLEFIQAIISRMASNSFILKGWTVTIVAGIFAIVGKDLNTIYFIFAYIPIIMFWFLDSYYLMQERLYRDLYENVRKQQENKVDFNMNIDSSSFKTKKNSFYNCFLSRTEFWFYIPLAFVVFCIIIFCSNIKE